MDENPGVGPRKSMMDFHWSLEGYQSSERTEGKGLRSKFSFSNLTKKSCDLSLLGVCSQDSYHEMTLSIQQPGDLGLLGWPGFQIFYTMIRSGAG